MKPAGLVLAGAALFLAAVLTGAWPHRGGVVSTVDLVGTEPVRHNGSSQVHAAGNGHPVAAVPAARTATLAPPREAAPAVVPAVREAAVFGRAESTIGLRPHRDRRQGHGHGPQTHRPHGHRPHDPRR